MATFTVNGKSVTVEKNQKLIRFLRDELHLTSVKDGCSEGACGTCHVLIDGKPTCLLYTSPSPRDRTRSRMPSSA